MNKNTTGNKQMWIIISMFIYVMLSLMPQPVDAFSEQVIQRGATGDDVVELQARLQYIGFYDGNIDGVFGWGTYWAVRNYQEDFGMEVTGLVGEKTKAMLEKSTEYDKEWVHQNIREGRKFTHYGTTPKDIQRGPKGSNDANKDGGSEQDSSGSQGEGGQTGEGQGAAPPPAQDTPQQNADPNPGNQQGDPSGTGQQGTPEGAEQQGQQQQDDAEGQQQGGQQDTAQPEQQEAEQEQPPEEEEVDSEQDNDTDVQAAINVPEGFTDNDIQLMAQAVYGEARGEPFVGQVAIAAVILNRVKSPTFPNTVSGVIFEPRAFTAVADGQIYMEPNETARKAVLDAINGQDPTGSAIYYFNPQTATNKWIWSRPQIKQIGKHIFCK